jgi:hypothetical protein
MIGSKTISAFAPDRARARVRLENIETERWRDISPLRG